MNTSALLNARTVANTFVAGTHPEHADMGNPRGEYYRTNFFVEAQVEGANEAFAHFAAFESEEEADALRVRIEVAGEINLDRLNAEGSRCWTAYRIPYGNPGWDEQELAAEMQDARRAGERHPCDR